MFLASSATDVSLDKYLSQNTSEDNMSFDEIMKESEKKHRMKHAWLYEKEEEQQIVGYVYPFLGIP